MKALFLITALSITAAAQTFDPSWTKVPSTFPGENLKQVIEELRKSPQIKPKDEFETMAQYEARIENLKAIRFGPTSTAAGDLVFRHFRENTYSVLGGLRSSYDAENQVLNVSIQLRRLRFTHIWKDLGDDRAFQGVEMDEPILTKIQKIGVDTHMLDSYYVGVNNALEFGGRGTISRGLKLPPDIAKDAKANMAVLVIGRITYPFHGWDVTAVEPTFANPRKLYGSAYYLIADVSQIWFFNERTGEVYAKLKPNTAPLSKPLQ